MSGDTVQLPYTYDHLTAEHERRLATAQTRRQAPAHHSHLRRLLASALLAAGDRLAGDASLQPAAAPTARRSRVVPPAVPVGCHG